MTRAVLPNPSARAEWLARIIDRAVHHWGYAPPLDRGLRDHDHADSETDTAIPDDDDDIASLASHVRISAAIKPLNCLALPCGADCFRLVMILPGDSVSHCVPRRSTSPGDFELENVFVDHEVSWPIIDERFALEVETYRRCFPAQPFPLCTAEVPQVQVRSPPARPRCHS